MRTFPSSFSSRFFVATLLWYSPHAARLPLHLSDSLHRPRCINRALAYATGASGREHEKGTWNFRKNIHEPLKVVYYYYGISIQRLTVHSASCFVNRNSNLISHCFIEAYVYIILYWNKSYFFFLYYSIISYSESINNYMRIQIKAGS